MNQNIRTSLATTILTLLAASASAVIKDYNLGETSAVVANAGENGLTIGTSLVSGLGNNSFSLEDGQSHTIGFFNIWTPESTVNADDKAPQPIVAKLNFAVPEVDAVFGGVTFGGSITWLFILNEQYAKVVWDAPVTLDLLGDREFTVSLSDEVFNKGLYGLGNTGARVDATITQISSQGGQSPGVESLPDSGSTLFFLGGGLLAMVLICRASGRIHRVQ